MKIFITLFLSCVLVMHSLVIPALVISYKMNRQFITANFCENKENPTLHCNGKCFLKKQIQKADAEEKNEKKFFLKLLPEFLSFQEFQRIQNIFSPLEIIRKPVSAEVVIQKTLSIFHPPKI